MGLQPDRNRLLRAAANLGGLRGWLAFDAGDESGAELWYRSAIGLAEEAGDPATQGWLLGGSSLLPSYFGHSRSALQLVQRGVRAACCGTDLAVQAWLFALEARAQAALGDVRAFRIANDSAATAASKAPILERRHGMDVEGHDLDLRYYEGTSLLSLGRSGAARPILQRALDALAPERVKARSIILLALGRAAALDREVDRACSLAHEALTLSASQCIRPILDRARELRGELRAWDDAPCVRELDEVLAG